MVFWVIVSLFAGVLVWAWLLDRRRARYMHERGLRQDNSIGKWYLQAMLGPGTHDPYTSASLDRKHRTD